MGMNVDPRVVGSCEPVALVGLWGRGLGEGHGGRFGKESVAQESEP